VVLTVVVVSANAAVLKLTEPARIDANTISLRLDIEISYELLMY
jgi:hypothetical protein